MRNVRGLLRSVVIADEVSALQDLTVGFSLSRNAQHFYFFSSVSSFGFGSFFASITI